MLCFPILATHMADFAREPLLPQKLFLKSMVPNASGTMDFIIPRGSIIPEVHYEGQLERHRYTQAALGAARGRASGQARVYAVAIWRTPRPPS